MCKLYKSLLAEIVDRQVACGHMNGYGDSERELLSRQDVHHSTTLSSLNDVILSSFRICWQ